MASAPVTFVHVPVLALRPTHRATVRTWIQGNRLTTRRERHEPVLQARRCNPSMAANKSKGDKDSFAALEVDIRSYLENCEDPGGSPLAYLNLGKAGRTDLISRIMDFGGYMEVSRRLNLPVDKREFIPPPQVFDPNEKPVFNKVETGASLALGRDLEARLSTIDTVKQSVVDESTGRPRKASPNGRQSIPVPSGQDLLRQNQQIAPPIIDESIPEGERFVLPASMRVGLVLLAALAAIGFGRSSVGVLSADVLSTCQSLTAVLGTAHIAAAIYAGAWLAPQLKRNSLLWFLKVLLSGPIGIRYLVALGSL